MRPEIEFRQETEMDNLAEIQVSMFAICEGGSGATRPDIPEIASEYVAADRPETSAAFLTSPEKNPNFTTQTSISHKRLPGLKSMSYTDRSKCLGLTTVELRRLHRDLIFSYKIVFGMGGGQQLVRYY